MPTKTANDPFPSGDSLIKLRPSLTGSWFVEGPVVRLPAQADNATLRPVLAVMVEPGALLRTPCDDAVLTDVLLGVARFDLQNIFPDTSAGGVAPQLAMEVRVGCGSPGETLASATTTAINAPGDSGMLITAQGFAGVQFELWVRSTSTACSIRVACGASLYSGGEQAFATGKLVGAAGATVIVIRK